MTNFIKKHYTVILLGFLTVAFFAEFFLKGYLLEGTGDRIESMVPQEMFAARALKSGQIPEWDPHLYCGVPYIGTGYHNFFYPPRMLAYLFPEKSLLFVFTVLAILHLFLAGFLFMKFASSVIKDKFWILMSGIVYAFSFTMTYNMNYGGDCAVGLTWLPLWLYFINTSDKRTFSRNLVYNAVVISLIILSGNMQFILYLVALGSAYALYKCVDTSGAKPSFDKSRVLLLFSSLALAAAITAVRTFPFIALAKTYSGSFTTSFEELAKFDKTRPIALLRLFVPFFLSGDNGFFMGGLGPPISFNVYFGILAAYMSVFAILFVWTKESSFWKTIIAVIVLIILGTPVARMQFFLTGGNYLTFSRYMWLLPVPFAALFGITGERITTGKIRPLYFVMFMAAAFAALIVIMYMTWSAAVAGMNKFAAVRPGMFQANKPLFDSLFRNMSNSAIYFAAGTVCAGIAVVLASAGERFRRFGWGFIFLLVSIDLLSMSRANIAYQWNFLTPAPFAPATKNEELVSDLFEKRNRSFRVLGDTKNTRLDGLIRLGLYKPTGWGATPPVKLAYLYKLENTSRIKTMDNFPKDSVTPRLCSVAFRLQNNDTVSIVPDYIPRVKLYTDYVVAPDDASAREKLLTGMIDLTKTVVLDKNPGFPPDNSPCSSSAVITSDTGNTLRITAFPFKDSILLLTDSYYDGWQAFVDGKPAEIFRANVAFRAVRLTPGKHTVLFRFRQAGLRPGAAVTAVSLVFLLIFSWRRFLRPLLPPSSRRGSY